MHLPRGWDAALLHPGQCRATSGRALAQDVARESTDARHAVRRIAGEMPAVRRAHVTGSRDAAPTVAARALT
jgi:hypothetical protein